jgi:hypothetical protein
MPTKSQVEAKQHQAALRRAGYEDRDARVRKLAQDAAVKTPQQVVWPQPTAAKMPAATGRAMSASVLNNRR